MATQLKIRAIAKDCVEPFPGIGQSMAIRIHAVGRESWAVIANSDCDRRAVAANVDADIEPARSGIRFRPLFVASTPGRKRIPLRARI